MLRCSKHTMKDHSAVAKIGNSFARSLQSLMNGGLNVSKIYIVKRWHGRRCRQVQRFRYTSRHRYTSQPWSLNKILSSGINRVDEVNNNCGIRIRRLKVSYRTRFTAVERLALLFDKVSLHRYHQCKHWSLIATCFYVRDGIDRSN